MKKIKKGDFGYFKNEKRKRILVTLVMLLIPVIILVSGWIYHGTRMNILTVVAAVGALPACKSAVGMVMMLMRKSMDRGLYEEIEQHKGNLDILYEMYITFYEKSSYFDSFVICGNNMVGFTTDPNVDIAYMTDHIQKTIRKNGYKVSVYILKDKKKYLERLDSLNEHRESIEADIKFVPDERYPDLTRNQLIAHTLLAICL